jgi:SAM-dependent methyltransferase
MYARSAQFYDPLYRAMGKDYAAEAHAVHEIVESRKGSSGNALLDAACGTGLHLTHLREWYDCEGIDVDRAMLSIAAERLPGVRLQCMDMIGFHLDRPFDAIVSLFGSVGYLPNTGRLDQVVRDMARHLNPGGVLIVEPWIAPEKWEDGFVSALFVDEPDLKISRMSVSRRDGNISILNFHFTIAQRDGIRTFTEPHRMTLFTDAEYRHAFEAAKLVVEFDPVGLDGRGLYIGVKPKI